MNTTPTMTLDETNGCRGIRSPHRAARPPPAASRPSSPRIEVTGPARTALRRDPHARGARVPRRAARPLRATPGTNCSRCACRPGSTRRTAATRTSCPRPSGSATTRRGASPAPAPGLEDRRVEITGPTDRKMAINALNSGAKVWLADQEDATSPTWANVIEGQLTLRDFLRGTLEYTSPEGKEYRVTAAETPTIVMRPRGWHLVEKHLKFHDRAGRAMHASGSLVDFGLYFFHNAKALIAAGRGPYFYLPKLESHREAKLWNDIFVYAQDRARHPAGHRPRDGAHRDDPGRVRDGRDPLRAARPLRGPQRRPLGLHLLDREDVPLARPPLGAARPQVDHHDRAVHAGVHRAARRDLPQARARTRSAA